MSAITQLNLAVESWGLLFSLICILCVFFLQTEDTGMRAQFRRMFLLNSLFLFMDIAGILLDGRSGAGVSQALRIIYTLDYILCYEVLAAFAAYVLTVIQRKYSPAESWKSKICILCHAGALVSFADLWMPVMFTIDAENHYHRTEHLWIAGQLLVLLIVVLTGIVLMLARDTLERMEKIFLILYLLIPLTAVILQVTVQGISAIHEAATLMLMVCFVSMQYGASETVRQQQILMHQQDAELTESRAQIMLTQIQPHFLYNSLNTIYYLCEKDPELAQKAVGDFADYLRANINSLKNREPVTFDRELQHVRTYLWLEQLRFGDRLKVFYNITSRSFRLPALTIQPLVENSVKHGICGRPEGGSIEISTRETAEFYEITIVDNGVGFDPARLPEDGREHVGIENVRRRLMLEAGGTLTVTSQPDIGTTSQIRLPKENNL